MSHYLYFEHESESLVDRFGSEESFGNGFEIIGLNKWRELTKELLNYLEEKNEGNSNAKWTKKELVDRLTSYSFFMDRNVEDLIETFETMSPEELILIVLRTELINKYSTLPNNICPRLFISHRRFDTTMALKLALYTKQCGFAYWIDVEDPYLKELEKRKDEEKIKKILPRLTACIIEMALINCTHVLAYLSPNSKGSSWVPYEYGRITKTPEYFGRACALQSQDLNAADFPDYMHLGVVAYTQRKVEKWLMGQKNMWDKNGTSKPDDLLDLFKKHSDDWITQAIRDSSKEYGVDHSKSDESISKMTRISMGPKHKL